MGKGAGFCARRPRITRQDSFPTLKGSNRSVLPRPGRFLRAREREKLRPYKTGPRYACLGSCHCCREQFGGSTIPHI